MTIAERNYHKRLLEMCDCYLETDFKTSLQRMTGSESADVEEDALKYLALAILETMTEKAKKLSFKDKKGNKTVTVQNEDKNSLPLPGDAVFEKIFTMMRDILDLQESKGKSTLSLGLKNGQVDVEVKIEEQADKRVLKIKFPTE